MAAKRLLSEQVLVTSASDGLSMTQDPQSLNKLVGHQRAGSGLRPRLDRRQPNSAVPLDTLDQERMGIAWKE